MGQNFSFGIKSLKNKSQVSKSRKRAAKKLWRKAVSANWGNITLSVLMIVLIGIIGVMYLFEINTMATKGYQIRELEQQLSELKEANGELELEARSLQTIQNLDSDVTSLRLVPSQAVRYISPSDYAYNN